MKKILLTSMAVTLLCAGLTAQSRKLKGQAFEQQTAKEAHSHEAPANIIRCGSGIPDPKWDAAFNILVEQYKQNLSTGKATAATYTIPVIVHVIHNAEVKGGATSYNISQAQVNSQITVLNQDYGGTNADISQCPAAFTSLKAGNTGITFCMVTKDPNGNTLAEPGIDRIDRNAKGWTAPPYAQSYIDGTIKPASIWDPTKYFNIWACNLGGGLLGYATFPAGSGLSGLSGTGTATTDGVVLLGSAFGNTGYQSIAAYNKGRSGTHETGHWLGLRHIWGDGNCLTDYCNDTPPAEGNHFNCISPGTPYHVNMCGAGTSPNGEMTMNYMDYTDDACMFMFTADQNTRFQTCMANGTYRKLLTTNATTECGLSSSTPVAAFTYPSQICTSVAAAFSDGSTGPPTSWLWAVSPSTGVTISTTTSQNPNITFTNVGSYSVTLTATNSNGNNSITHTVSVQNCANTCDTMKNVTDLTSIALYYADAVAPRDSGYLSGTNKWGDLAKAEKYTYLNNGKLLKGIRAYLYVKGTGNATFNVWNDNAGKPGTVVASKTVALNTLVTGYNNIMLTTAITPPATFYVGFTIPTTSANGDTLCSITNNATTGGGTAGTGWEQWSDNSWNDYSTVYSATISNYMFPFLCPSAGMSEYNILDGVFIFPNPSKGQFNIALNLASSTDLNVAVTNMLGETIYQKTDRGVMHGNVSLDLSGVAKGVYFVHISDSNNKRMVEKIIIE